MKIENKKVKQQDYNLKNSGKNKELKKKKKRAGKNGELKKGGEKG